MKLELKYVAPYLPYNLQGLCKWEHLDKEYEVELYGVSSDFLNISNPFGGQDYTEIEEFKPILRPLSDLTKEIEHNGEKFLPIRKISSVYDVCIRDGFVFNTEGFYYTHKDMNRGDIELRTTYGFFQKLLEWHFDIFGLIENDLAIDINTL